MRRLSFVGLALALVLLAPRAWAQSCCTATGSNEFGVVGRCHVAVFAAQLGWDHGLWSFDQNRKARSLDGVRADDGVLFLGGGIRLGTPRLQIHGSVPLKLQHRSLEGLPASTRAGVGDATVALRAMALEDLVAGIDLHDARTLIPFLEPFVGTRAPSGRSPSGSDDPTQADVTGDGAWMVFAGVAITKFLSLHHAVTLSGSVGHRFAHDVRSAGSATQHFEPGQELDAKLGYVQMLDLFWSWSLFASYRGTTDVAYDGTAVADSASRRVRVGASVTRYLTYPTWQLSLSGSIDPPVDGLSRNVPFAGSSLTLTFQRNFTY